jgi:lysophospholipase L1-like esterase
VGTEHFDGTSDWVISADRVHPSPAGIHYLGQKLADAIKALVQ